MACPIDAEESDAGSSRANCPLHSRDLRRPEFTFNTIIDNLFRVDRSFTSLPLIFPAVRPDPTFDFFDTIAPLEKDSFAFVIECFSRAPHNLFHDEFGLQSQ